MGIEGIEQRLDQPRLGELLAIQPNCRRVRHPILEAQAQEAHEREPVADLILDLVVREIVERLQNQRLESLWVTFPAACGVSSMDEHLQLQYPAACGGDPL